jgi:hypothetical protein
MRRGPVPIHFVRRPNRCVELLFPQLGASLLIHSKQTASENDIREYVTRRKRSGSTRSDLCRRCRDTFASLKKTRRKLGLSFWHYLLDRLSGANSMTQLSDLVRRRAQEAKVLT